MLEHGGPGDCDAYELSDGCIVRHEGRWYLLHNARPYLGASRRFGMAVSDDLWNWTKLPGDGSAWFIPDPDVTGWREEGMMECKDQTIIYRDGTYYMYIHLPEDGGAIRRSSQADPHGDKRGHVQRPGRLEGPWGQWSRTGG